MMNRLLEFLFKLMLILVLAPAVLAMLLHSAFAVAKLFLPWIIVAIFITGAIAGVVFAARLRQGFPSTPRILSAQGGARPNAVRRPRGPRGKE